MKKLLFVAGSLRIGGIERSLLNLLQHLDYTIYEVDLFLYTNEGEYIKELPTNVRLINKSKILHILGLTMDEAKRTHHIVIILIRAIAAFLCKLMGNKRFWDWIFKIVPKISGYDVAIAYSNNVHDKSIYSGFYQFILDKVEAKRKVGWIHIDYQSMKNKSVYDIHFFDKLDQIIHVSYSNKKYFDQLFPKYRKKTYVIYNTLPVHKIIKKSKEMIHLPFTIKDDFLGVTVARLDKNKSIERLIEAINRLKERGYEVFWIIIGDGPERNKLRQMITMYHLGKNIYLLGKLSNPYSYIRRADLFVLCSQYEGFPMTIMEAKIIGTPVLVTRYAAAKEQIKDKYDGIITRNSTEDLFISLKYLLDHPNQMKQIRKHLKQDKFNNDLALTQFDSMINIKEPEGRVTL